VRELDPRGYEVIPMGAPQGEEKRHHHLWRFWKALPKAGHFTIYDRSWYGRVLVERIEGFAKPEEWMRAYSEINEFELQLVKWGAIMIKFWLHISP
jgi:polyphosphate kinase 2 (PPK2 family)